MAKQETILVDSTTSYDANHLSTFIKYWITQFRTTYSLFFKTEADNEPFAVFQILDTGPSANKEGLPKFYVAGEPGFGGI